MFKLFVMYQEILRLYVDEMNINFNEILALIDFFFDSCRFYTVGRITKKLFKKNFNRLEKKLLSR